MCCGEVAGITSKVEPIASLVLRTRKTLKGHRSKVLHLDWCEDRRRLVCSTQVCSHLHNWPLAEGIFVADGGKAHNQMRILMLEKLRPHYLVRSGDVAMSGKIH